jgi:hypothetical protein
MESLTVTGIEMGEGESKPAQLITTVNSKERRFEPFFKRFLVL